MSLFDEFTKGVGNAVTDIRQKVVEEPYFGRAVTEGSEPAAAPEAQPVAPAAAPQSAWDAQVQQVPDTPAPGRDIDAPDHGIDR